MRLFIADADWHLRVALQILLNQEPDIQVIGMAAGAKRLVDQIEASEPDMLLIDWYLPGMLVRDLLPGLQALDTAPKIVVLSVRPEDKSAAIAAGADLFIEKGNAPEELLETLRNISKPKHVE